MRNDQYGGDCPINLIIIIIIEYDLYHYGLLAAAPVATVLLSAVTVAFITMSSSECQQHGRLCEINISSWWSLVASAVVAADGVTTMGMGMGMEMMTAAARRCRVNNYYHDVSLTAAVIWAAVAVGSRSSLRLPLVHQSARDCCLWWLMIDASMPLYCCVDAW